MVSFVWVFGGCFCGGGLWGCWGFFLGCVVWGGVLGGLWLVM
ncbi:hypothetical protein [Pseudomonas syringae group genomosp. 7]